jgi:glyoxylase-like metal-dependent hydrolase (beta-lactamase superfamily II)
MSKLNWKLLLRKRPGVTQGLPPGKEELAWVTNTVTLMYGEHDAILVDTFLSVQHSNELVEWLLESGKNLTAVYVTHGHGDHFLGLKLVLNKFPNAKAYATASSVAAMQSQIRPDVLQSFWERRFPGQLPSELALPEVLGGDTLYLEGEELKVIPLGHTDTVDTTALYVPSIGLVVSGDAVYNSTHPYLVECDENGRGEWLAALDRIEALHPQAVVAGHAITEPDSSPRHIEETRRYIRDVNTVAANTSTALEFYQKMLTLHPNRVNPGSLWATANALKPPHRNVAP